jgi:restriction system protein
MPDRSAYQVAAPAGLRSLSPAKRRDYQHACEQAQARFEQDWRAAASREDQRQRQLGEYYRQYQAWLAGEQQVAADHNAQIDALAVQVADGEPAAVREFFSAALVASPWPSGFPHGGRVAWDPRAGQLIVDWELPGLDVVPAVARHRYVKAGDRDIEVSRPVGERGALYRQLLARCALRVLAVAYRADQRGMIQLATVNGYVHGSDPVTGKAREVFVVTLTASHPSFTGIDLTQVDPVACVEGLGGQLSTRPDKPVAIQPGRLARPPAPASSGQRGGRVPDLQDMDPIDFEDLVAALFQRLGFDVMTTERTGDGGVDVRAIDPDPIRGGKLVIQVKALPPHHPPGPGPRPVRHHAPRRRDQGNPGHHRRIRPRRAAIRHRQTPHPYRRQPAQHPALRARTPCITRFKQDTTARTSSSVLKVRLMNTTCSSADRQVRTTSRRQ